MSSRKDQITTDHSRSEVNRVANEQEYVKEKGHEVAAKARDVKEGNVSMPSNATINSKLQHGQETLTSLQASDRGMNMNNAGDKVVEDIKRVLADQQQLIGDKNEGDILQNIVRDFWALLQELQQNSELKVYFEEWQGTVTSIFTSGDFSAFFHQTGDLFTSIRDTDEFLSLASELVDLMKIVVAEATEKAVEGDSTTKDEYKRQREMERRRVARELRYTLSSMTRNDVWRNLVHTSKAKAHQAKDVTRGQAQKAETVFYNLRASPNFQRLLGDFKLLLQRLVGRQMSVDPLFEYSKQALDDVAEDDQLAQVVDEMQRILPALAEDTAMLDDPNVQRELDNLSRRADDAIMRLRNNRNIKGAKEESLKIANAIKNEATNTPLLADLKTLWRDLASGKAGEVIDPDVLRSLRQMIVPLLVEHLNNVPLPAVSDQANFLGKYFYTIDQMKISLPDLIPENIHLRFEYEMDANPLELEAKNQHTFLYVQVSHLQLHLHDCHFSYERRTIPKHSDSGIFDVDTVGEGLTAWLKMEIKSDSTKGQFLDVLKSDVKISKFHITFRDSKHDHLYEMITHLLQKKIRDSVIEMIQTKLKTFGSYFNNQIITLIEQAKHSSNSITKIAREKTDQARHGIERMQIKADETKREAKSNIHDAKSNLESDINSNSQVQQTKQEAKSTVKFAVERMGEKVQQRLDEAKVEIEQEKRNRQLDTAMGTPSAADMLNSNPNDLITLPLEPAHLVTPQVHDSPIPFTSHEPSMLGGSSETYSTTSFNTVPQQGDSMIQFSPMLAKPNPSQQGAGWVAAAPHDPHQQSL